MAIARYVQNKFSRQFPTFHSGWPIWRENKVHSHWQWGRTLCDWLNLCHVGRSVNSLCPIFSSCSSYLIHSYYASLGFFRHSRSHRLVRVVLFKLVNPFCSANPRAPATLDRSSKMVAFSCTLIAMWWFLLSPHCHRHCWHCYCQYSGILFSGQFSP